jgi:hypothetical protein
MGEQTGGSANCGLGTQRDALFSVGTHWVTSGHSATAFCHVPYPHSLQHPPDTGL